MKEHEAIGTAWLRVGKSGGRFSAVLTYSALLMLIPASEQRKQIKLQSIALQSGLHRNTVMKALKWLSASNLVEVGKWGTAAAEFTLKPQK